MVGHLAWRDGDGETDQTSQREEASAGHRLEDDSG